MGQIEFYDLNTLLEDLPTAQELKFFPGSSSPLIRIFLQKNECAGMLKYLSLVSIRSSDSGAEPQAAGDEFLPAEDPQSV